MKLVKIHIRRGNKIKERMRSWPERSTSGLKKKKKGILVVTATLCMIERVPNERENSYK